VAPHTKHAINSSNLFRCRVEILTFDPLMKGKRHMCQKTPRLKPLQGNHRIYIHSPVFGKNAFRPTLKPKRKPEKNFKFGLIWVKFAFLPSEKRPKRIFPRNTFFPKTGSVNLLVKKEKNTGCQSYQTFCLLCKSRQIGKTISPQWFGSRIN
jgi:hypothetical protein